MLVSRTKNGNSDLCTDTKISSDYEFNVLTYTTTQDDYAVIGDNGLIS